MRIIKNWLCKKGNLTKNTKLNSNTIISIIINNRKILMENGRENYKPSTTEISRQPSPTKGRSPGSTLKNSQNVNGLSTTKSTSTISDILNEKGGKMPEIIKKGLRDDLGLFDTKEIGNVEFEEENDQRLKDDEDEESEPSWQKKSGSEDSSDGFHKPVDFGIDRETSIKLDKLNVMLMVGKEPNRQSIESVGSAPTSSREVLDSPTRNYVKNVLGLKDEDLDLKKSIDSNKISFSSAIDDIKSKKLENQGDYKTQLKLFQESLER